VVLVLPRGRSAHAAVRRCAEGGSALSRLSSASESGTGVPAGAKEGRVNEPDSVSSDGTHAWITNYVSNTVTELNSSTGALVQILSGASFGFDNPDAVSSDGTHVWVASSSGNVSSGDALTELDASTGALVRVISGTTYDFFDSDAVSSDGTDVWATNYALDSVTGFPAG
jgi:DNA-binding beta-propeller fold protein YncE